jgi:hypothetical protein
MPMCTTVTAIAQRRSNERGAALVTMLLVSLLLLAAGGTLIMTSALSATNATDSIAETQAYYAGEAGMQAALNVLRGNVAAIDFGSAVSNPSLSSWLTYDSTYSRVTLTNNYSPLNGMAYSVSVLDPDNTGTVIFNMDGAFSNSTRTLTVGTTNSDQVTITYSPPGTNPATVNSTGTAPFGSFQFTPLKASQFASYNIGTLFPQGIPFNLTLTQKSPYPSTTASPTVVVIACKLTGVISSTTSSNTVQFSFIPPTSNPTGTSNLIAGVSYARTTNSFPLSYATATTITPVTVTAPEPSRLVVKVVGYGPRAAEKHLQMMVSRFAFDFKANAAVTLRSADDGSAMSTFDIGNSSQYRYSGNDYSGGGAVPAFAVTSGTNYVQATSATAGNPQVTGSSPLQQIPISSLSDMLQTAQGARDALDILREQAQGQYWPADLPPADRTPANDRYFPAGTTPSTFGTEDDPLTTFVDGDAVLPSGGGAGMLIVTGTLDMRGNADFKGLILVLGAGQVLRNGGGNGVTLGSIFVASFGSTGNFLAPSFDSNGGGTSDIFYDSKWVDKALMTAGPSVKGVTEY